MTREIKQEQEQFTIAAAALGVLAAAGPFIAAVGVYFIWTTGTIPTSVVELAQTWATGIAALGTLSAGGVAVRDWRRPWREPPPYEEVP